jgi:hypothetical protein
MANVNVSISQFEHRVGVFVAPFVAAGAFAVEQGIQNGTLSLTTVDEKGIAIAFASGVLIAILNVLRSQAAPTPPPSTAMVASAAKVVATATKDGTVPPPVA